MAYITDILGDKVDDQGIKMNDKCLGKAKEPWIGLVHARPLVDRHPLGEEVKGVYVNMVALASSAANYRSLAERDLLLDDLVLVDIEDLDTVSAYRAEGRIGPELDELICSLSEEAPIKADIFAPYSTDDS